MSHYGNSMNGRRSPMGWPTSTTTPSAAAQKRPAGTVLPAMTAASGIRTPQGHAPVQVPRRPPASATATTETYGARHAYGSQIQAQLNAAKEAAEHQSAVSEEVLIEMFGDVVEPEVDLDEVGALLEEADALLEDLESP
jgi:hypothetical protein